MAIEPKRIHVEPGSEVAELLDEASERPLILETNGELYRLDRVEQPEDIWAGYDPDAAIAAIKEAAGSWGDLDPEEVKAFIYRAREEGTRPAIRPRI